MKKGTLGYGGSVAAPSFRRVGEKIIAYLGLEPPVPKEFATRFGEGNRAL